MALAYVLAVLNFPYEISVIIQKLQLLISVFPGIMKFLNFLFVHIVIVVRLFNIISSFFLYNFMSSIIQHSFLCNSIKAITVLVCLLLLWYCFAIFMFASLIFVVAVLIYFTIRSNGRRTDKCLCNKWSLIASSMGPLMH